MQDEMMLEDQGLLRCRGGKSSFSDEDNPMFSDEDDSTAYRLDERIAEGLDAFTPRSSSRDERQALGRAGEESAAKFLLAHDYEILERNWKCSFGEADIIANDGESLVFIEVKTRSGITSGFPEEAITLRKRQRYERIAAAYLTSHGGSGTFIVRFDVIAILTLGDHRAFLRHHRNAFLSAGE
jgi:putative endonuclease